MSEDKPDPTFFIDKDFHNIGIGILRHNVVALACKAEQEIDSGKIIDVDQSAIQSDTSVVGRFLVTKKENDIASFKTPNLRNVLITAPRISTMDFKQRYGTWWIITTIVTAYRIRGSMKTCSLWH